MCNDRQQFAHCVQSIWAKYFWLKALTTPSISSGACCFSHDRNSQFSSSRSRESCWILARSVSIAGTATRFFRLIPASRSKAAQHLSNIIRFVRWVARPLRAKNSWVAYLCGFGLRKGRAFLIHAGQTEEEPTLCKNH